MQPNTDLPTIETLTTPLRHCADRGTFVGHLRSLAEAAFDVVAPQSALTVALSTAMLSTAEPILTDHGVYDGLSASMSRTAWRQLAERLRIPLTYLDRLCEDGHTDLAEHNVNTLTGRDTRVALWRFLRANDGLMLRAVLSDRYGIMDNLDAFVTVAQGMADAGLSLDAAEVDVDWTPERFRMRVAVPQVTEDIADLVAGYRPPMYSMAAGAPTHAPAGPDERPPVLWAGIEVTNSETGGGAFAIAPRAVVLVCRNGLTRTIDAVRAVHLAGRLEQGAVTWTADTQARQRDLVLSMVADAARMFCSHEYLQRQVAEMRDAHGQPVASPSAAITVAQRLCAFTDAETASVLDAFLVGGQQTVLGLGQAVTAAAQACPDGDRQAEMENAFWAIVGPHARQLAEARA